MPIMIWVRSTPAEKDSFFLSAGFDPNLVTIDDGSDNNFVRFRQDEPFVAAPAVVPTIPQAAPVVVGGPQAGDDLRDFAAGLVDPDSITDEFGVAAPAGDQIAGAGIVIAGRALRLILGGGGGRLTAAIWNSLPSLVRSALVQVGIGVGALIAFNGDIPFITLPGQGSSVVPFDAQQEGGGTIGNVDIQIGAGPSMPHHFVGSWVANGVRFYRLQDGKLAVQNKKGRWKVWRPKRPIVLYADGASNLKTMLRADKALTKQAKQIAAVLNRRAPRPRKTEKKPHTGLIIPGSSVVIDT